MTRVLAGYSHVATAKPCPFCGDRHFAFEDDGDADTVLVRCWCGATARAQRDDPDLIAHLASHAAEPPGAAT